MRFPGGCPSGQREQTVNLPADAYGGSNPSPPTHAVDSRADFGGCAAEQTPVGPPPPDGAPTPWRPSCDSRADFGGCAAEGTPVGPPPPDGAPTPWRPSCDSRADFGGCAAEQTPVGPPGRVSAGSQSLDPATIGWLWQVRPHAMDRPDGTFHDRLHPSGPCFSSARWTRERQRVDRATSGEHAWSIGSALLIMSYPYPSPRRDRPVTRGTRRHLAPLRKGSPRATLKAMLRSGSSAPTRRRSAVWPPIPRH